MLSHLKQARQPRVIDTHCLFLPHDFPLPLFNFGDWVCTDEDDVGKIVGMSLVRLGEEQWWSYNLDLTVDSPNFWDYQGDHFGSETAQEERDSPSCYNYEEVRLQRINSLQEVDIATV